MVIVTKQVILCYDSKLRGITVLIEKVDVKTKQKHTPETSTLVPEFSVKTFIPVR